MMIGQERDKFVKLMHRFLRKNGIYAEYERKIHIMYSGSISPSNYLRLVDVDRFFDHIKASTGLGASISKKWIDAHIKYNRYLRKRGLIS